MASPELEALAWRLVRERCSRFSWLAAYYGEREYYSYLGHPSREQLDAYRSRLAGLLGEIDALLPELEGAGAIDREVLRLAVEYELFKHDHPPYEASNVSPTYLILDGIYDILRLSRLSDEERLTFVLSRLEQARGLFEPLRETWHVPMMLSLEDTIPQAPQVDKVLTTMLAPLMEGSPEQRPAIETLIAEIGQEGREFARWLEDEVKPGAEQVFYVMGGAAYEQLLAVRQEGHTWSSRLQLGEESLRRSRRRLEELVPQIAPEDGSLGAALEKVREDVPELPILEEARNAYQRVAHFLRERRLLHVPEARCAI
jgi:hypothetical protein